MAVGQTMTSGHTVRPRVVTEQKREHGSASLTTLTARELIVQDHPRRLRVAKEHNQTVSSFPRKRCIQCLFVHTVCLNLSRLPGGRWLHGRMQSQRGTSCRCLAIALLLATFHLFVLSGVWEDNCRAPGVAKYYWSAFIGNCCYCCHNGWCSKNTEVLRFN